MIRAKRLGLVRSAPFTLLGVLTILWILLVMWVMRGRWYDDGTWEFVLFLITMIVGPIFRWLYRNLRDLDILLGVTWGDSTVWALTFVVGLIPYVLMDFLLAYRRRKRRVNV